MDLPTLNRRRFLEGSLASSAVLLAACNGAAPSGAAAVAKPYTDKLGIQLYTYRELFEKDYESVLKTLAEIGYKDLEFAGYFEHDPKAVKATMDALGLVSNSTHVRVEQFREGFDEAIETAALMGQTKLILPWLAPEERNMDNYRAIADLLNERSSAAKAAGMTVGYHNHEFEFETLDGEVPYDVLLERTDADAVTMELDFFWAHKAGVDPIELFKIAPGRFTACHIKDSSATGEMVNIGDGVIDFAAIFAETELAGLECFYVENDDTTDPAAFAKASFDFLNS
ncbi:sugar phosphate isomerase/epimerase [Pontixanthobacter sp. CEM42]|uniref:sugar phosphate isomerase/epimerase family protein n=1 Tax=Pontixanthobacter sp. CEM42 TaxID=2792077 RepID=UPI001ADF3291|nr:sugar phosphate isomerase/epimerase [Pontixanthobacter sp. CEM42]